MHSTECAEQSYLSERSNHGQEIESVYRQHCVGFTVDNFIKQYNMKIPNYIKIDVDGIENLILNGAKKSLLADSLSSVLVEVNEKMTDQVEHICRVMKECGFRKIIKRHAPYFDDYYYKPFFNYLFFKE